MKNDPTTTDEFLAPLLEWQQANLTLFRDAIHKALPDVTEQIKWHVPVFMHGKTIIFAMAVFKEHTKFNFIRNGATIDDTDKLFNNGLESKQSRAIDLREGEAVDVAKLYRLVALSVARL